MAELIGNVVLLVIIFIVLRNFASSSGQMTTKARQVVKTIDNNLSQQESLNTRKNNPDRYCNSADYLTLAALVVHAESRHARKDLAISTERANDIRTKLLHELAER